MRIDGRIMPLFLVIPPKVDRYFEQPRLGGCFIFKLFRPAMGTQETVLCQVFRQMPISRQA